MSIVGKLGGVEGKNVISELINGGGGSGGSGGAFFVHVNNLSAQNVTEYSTDETAGEIYNAIVSGRPLVAIMETTEIIPPTGPVQVKDYTQFCVIGHEETGTGRYNITIMFYITSNPIIMSADTENDTFYFREIS